ncbi:hypothetical protein FISHEDRAFT_77580 [Fistulina hepatica ATCC 64428]|uniref:F-box domain-containing protein n=1 Tax=Fistulina hepatica ATCC 64428 TaxID=1128425 RepID=A0A0D7A0R3_9AGAR|nr:hypothetical protein FISHEDRAFT_77580 [Fistulina hepatica ATCC 64428]
MESESPRCPHRGLAPGELPFPEHHHNDDWLSSLQPRAGAVRLSAEQSAIVNAHVASENARVKCLRARLGDSESLVREVELALRRIAVYASLRAPIRWLPTEVLAEIFKASLPENIEDSSFTSKTSPLVLAHVSRCWRQVAFSTLDLWSSVCINWCNKTQCPPLHVLGEWLDRSAPYPLTVKAILGKFGSGGYINASSSEALRSIPILSSKSQRWEDVELVLPGLDTILIDNQPFPMLRSLRLETKKEVDRWIHITEEDAPHLSKVFLQLIRKTFLPCYSPFTSAAVLPYTQLTHYRGPAYREKDTECVLAFMPGLQYGDLECNPFDVEGMLPTSENILPSLSKLRIRSGRIELYQSIVAPALEHLVSSDIERQDAFSMVSCLVARSECRLKRLYITQSCIRPDINTFSFLFSPACEAVAELCIDIPLDVNALTTLCHELDVRGKRVPSLPSLEKLYFRCYLSGDFDRTIMFDAMRSRCGNVEKQVCPLQHLCAPDWLIDERKHWRQVNDLVDMDLVIEQIPGHDESGFRDSLVEL